MERTAHAGCGGDFDVGVGGIALGFPHRRQRSIASGGIPGDEQPAVPLVPGGVQGLQGGFHHVQDAVGQGLGMAERVGPGGGVQAQAGQVRHGHDEPAQVGGQGAQRGLRPKIEERHFVPHQFQAMHQDQERRLRRSSTPAGGQVDPPRVDPGFTARPHRGVLDALGGPPAGEGAKLGGIALQGLRQQGVFHARAVPGRLPALPAQDLQVGMLLGMDPQQGAFERMRRSRGTADPHRRRTEALREM